MSMPRRKTSSLRNSLWSCSNTGVRFIGEKPMAGCPAWGQESGVRMGLGQAPGTRGEAGISTHCSDVAAVSGSWEDLKLELQLPIKRDAVSARHGGSRVPQKQARKVPKP